MNMEQLLSVDTVFFTVLDYPMSYLEFFGTILNLVSVYLMARKNVVTWPVGIVAVIMFAMLFYQIRLYADFIEQIYYLLTSVYGWCVWLYGKKNGGERAARWSSLRTLLGWLMVTVVGSAGFTYFISNLHIWWPAWFPEAASYPGLDSFTTVGSFVAMLLMAHKRIECWIYWLVIDVLGVWLYFVKDVPFVGLLYVVFLGLAMMGLVNWLKQRSVHESRA
jgi:nicotinamide mononucleotide transporter